MAVLADGINIPDFARPDPSGPPAESGPPDGQPQPVNDEMVELVASLNVDTVLDRVRDGTLDAETAVAAERRGRQRTGVLAPLT